MSDYEPEEKKSKKKKKLKEEKVSRGDNSVMSKSSKKTKEEKHDMSGEDNTVTIASKSFKRKSNGTCLFRQLLRVISSKLRR